MHGPGGALSGGGCMVPGGVYGPGGHVVLGGCMVWGVYGPGGCMVLGGAWSWGVHGPGGCLVETPPDGYCCGRYISFWNAFLSFYAMYSEEWVHFIHSKI